jgi:hypothetical protein
VDELCQLDGDPAQTVAGLKAKKLTVYAKANTRRRTKIPKYTNVRIVDNQAIEKLIST